jgi:hypothetical protein
LPIAVLTYIDVSATFVGVDADFSFYLISIANAASGFGRLFAGVIADRLGLWLRLLLLFDVGTYNLSIGAINVTVPCTLLAGIMTYVWPFITTKASFVVIALFYG